MPKQRLYTPRPIAVETGPRGLPHAIAEVKVEAIREEWLIEDDWWGNRPLRRHYFELVLTDGRNTVVYRSEADPDRGRWYLQRG